MPALKLWGPLLAALTAALAGACTSPASPDCPRGQVYYSGGLFSQGGCAPPQAACRSWAMWITPGWAGGTEPQLAFDRSVSPARADLKVGARMQVGLVSGRFEPAGCGMDVRYQEWSFRSSDAAVLRLDSSTTAAARLLAVSPGTATVLAAGPTQPDGRRDAELSICIDPARFVDDKSCALMPLVIRVVP